MTLAIPTFHPQILSFVEIAFHWRGRDTGYIYILHCVSEKMSLICLGYNFDIPESILIGLGKIASEKVSNQKILSFPTSPSFTGACFCTTWRNAEAQNRIFSLKRCNCIVRLQPVAGLIYSVLLYSQLILMLLYVSLNLVVNGIMN